MRYLILLFASMFVIFTAEFSYAEMPAALEALGNVEILSDAEASTVRGDGAPVESESTQSMSFSTGAKSGNSTGSVIVSEGAIASFQYSKVSLSQGPDGEISQTLDIDGNLGGLTGAAGIDLNRGSLTFGGLNFLTQGKALNESTDFTGSFKQNFFQQFDFSSSIQEFGIVRQ